MAGGEIVLSAIMAGKGGAIHGHSHTVTGEQSLLGGLERNSDLLLSKRCQYTGGQAPAMNARARRGERALGGESKSRKA